MIDLITLLLINALAIVGIYLSFGREMIFEGLGRWIEKHIPYKFTKPLFNCPTCMASVHSIFPYWLGCELDLHNFLSYLIYVPALAGLSTWLSNQIVKE